MADKPNSVESAELRRRAEKRQRGRQPAVGSVKPEAETRRLVHELQVHQIELEMQNEELHEAQQRLEEARDHYAAFYDFAPVGYVTFDARGVIREINLTAADMLGAPRAQLMGQRFHPFVAPKDRAQFLSHLRERADPEEHGATEFRLIREGRADLAVAMRSVPACGAENKGHHCRATITDLTAQKKAEEALRKQRDFIDALLETAAALILVLDEAGRVLRFNRACEQLSGYSAVEIVGQTFWDLLTPEESAAFQAVFEELRTTHHPNRYENHWRSKTGEQRLISWANTVFTTGEGAVSAIILTGIDISERRRLEGEVLEIIDSEQRRIGTELHDDLGQKLAAIAFMCHALRQDLAGQPKLEKQAAALDGLMSDAIRQTRELSHGLAPLHLVSVGLIQALEGLAQTTNDAGNVKCCLRCPTGIHIAESAVAGQLYRIAQEAVNNALKHGAPGKIEITLRHRKGALRLRISDNGKGFPEHRSAQAGMGLSVMKYRAEIVGGTLLIESKQGKGVKVDCTVPLTKS